MNKRLKRDTLGLLDASKHTLRLYYDITLQPAIAGNSHCTDSGKTFYQLRLYLMWFQPSNICQCSSGCGWGGKECASHSCWRASGCVRAAGVTGLLCLFLGLSDIKNMPPCLQPFWCWYFHSAPTFTRSHHFLFDYSRDDVQRRSVNRVLHQPLRKVIP